MMCLCFVRHGYQPYLLVGGATGQIGDPKENGERDLKPLAEVEHNKLKIQSQLQSIFANAAALSDDSLKLPGITFLDNLDWFKEIKFLDFLREIGKSFSMTQLLDRQFVQNRIGKDGSGISYAEFSYTLIQGYDFLHLFREYGISLQLCGADQYGNCASGIHLIKRLENATADVWSTPLIIDPVSGKKFGKSEGNAVWLASEATSVFDFYQFWLNQPDSSVEYLLKIYTLLSREEIEDILSRHQEAPEKRLAQTALAKNATAVVHGEAAARDISWATDFLFSKSPEYTEENLLALERALGGFNWGETDSLLDVLVKTSLASSKSEARKLLKSGAISFNGEKLIDEAFRPASAGVLKRGKNKFALLK